MKYFILATSLVCASFVTGCGSSTEPPSNISASHSSDSAQRDHSTAATESSSSATTKESEAESTSEKRDPSSSSDLPTKSRRFAFHYRFKVKDLKSSEDAASSVVRVWLPSATASDEQDVRRLEPIAPAEVTEKVDDQFGNRILFFETKIPESGEFTVDIPYEVTRREVLRGPSRAAATVGEKLDDAKRQFFLRADAMVPTTGKSLKLLDMIELMQDKFARARQLYDIVDHHVAYKKEGTGWGRGDTNWVCDSRYGNCTDFHSLFISLARSQGLPSRFEIGFSIPTDKPEGPIAGYHCWAWFYNDERGWIPVDISEADKNPMMKDYYFGGLTADRVTFSVGRDISLVPKSESQPLNFFIYPHIEVGGKVLPKENVELQFAFKDQT